MKGRTLSLGNLERWLIVAPLIVFFSAGFARADRDEAEDLEGPALTITQAEWKSSPQRLAVEGRGSNGATVTVVNADDPSQVLGSDQVEDRSWETATERPAPVPCRIRVVQSDGGTAERDVGGAPDDCGSSEVTSAAVPTVPNITVDDVTVSEGAGSAVFTVSLSKVTDEPVSVQYATADGSASWREDYRSTRGRVLIAAGAASATIDVPIVDDDFVEPDETFSVVLSFAYGGVVTDARGVATILDNDDDTPPPVVPDITINDITVDEGAGSAVFTVSLSEATSEPVSVQYATADGSASWREDYRSTRGRVNIAAGATSATIDVPIVDDDVVEPDETFGVVLSFARSGVVTDASGVATIQDNDTAPPPDELPEPVSQESNTGLLGRDLGTHVVLGANDLGMHCADQDDSIFSVLPPFNVLHAQVIKRGSRPTILDGTEVQVTYSAASNPNDPAAPNSINSTSANFPIAAVADLQVFKGNFWDQNPLTGNPQGYDTFEPLFFGLLTPDAVVIDLGLPAPETTALTACLPPPLGSGAPDGSDCHFEQQAMPGISDPYLANVAQPMHFDKDTGFFADLLGADDSIPGVANHPLGGLITDVNWFRADGIPILPVDDMGRGNAYPLVRVQAKQGNTTLASTDVVLPVAAEADCQLCHAEPLDCADPRLPIELQSSECNGIAVSPTRVSGTTFEVETIDSAPGFTIEQNLLNASKINILRLHDAKHGTSLDAARNVVCASCHYSPALDLAQVGPQGDQTVNISMSRAMHGHHGDLLVDGALVFPDMPPPDQRGVGEQQDILNQTCYQCHPGKRTQCLRGAMGGAGIVCQDCHGNMTQVGNDFTGGGPRVSWASEPKCQSCHTGDVMELNRPADTIVAPDGIRLLQAYTRAEHSENGGDALPILAGASRFAENETLFRLSGNDDGSGKGHGGIMCEGCHGSTHAIWPNANPDANDNVAANQLQGHAGTISECATCHTGELGNTLEGPHGLHPVGSSTRFARGGHEDLAEDDPNACRACHGRNGEGTVLSKLPVERQLNGRNYPAGHEVGCTECHRNEL